MRWSALVLLLAIVPAASATEPEAEKLFRAMEKKVRAARQCRLVFEGVTTVDAAKVPYRGSFHRDGTKFCFALQADAEGSGVQRIAVCDGSTLFSNFGREVMAPIAVTDEDVEKGQGLCARAGVSFFANVMRVGPPRSKDIDLDAVLKAEDFHLGAREKIGTHEAQVVDYALLFSSAQIKASVWIDTETLLPLKYAVTTKVAVRGPVTDVQNFTAFEVDVNTDPHLFEMPTRKVKSGK